jgi:hypothetical protein
MVIERAAAMEADGITDCDRADRLKIINDLPAAFEAVAARKLMLKGMLGWRYYLSRSCDANG